MAHVEAETLFGVPPFHKFTNDEIREFIKILKRDYKKSKWRGETEDAAHFRELMLMWRGELDIRRGKI